MTQLPGCGLWGGDGLSWASDSPPGWWTFGQTPILLPPDCGGRLHPCLWGRTDKPQCLSPQPGTWEEVEGGTSGGWSLPARVTTTHVRTWPALSTRASRLRAHTHVSVHLFTRLTHCCLSRMRADQPPGSSGIASQPAWAALGSWALGHPRRGRQPREAPRRHTAPPGGQQE